MNEADFIIYPWGLYWVCVHASSGKVVWVYE